ncbi:MAG: hypothetical protein COU68_03720, partial [Candidatus Pacebacteria bacterium CG10_big_fil_rev_8_21_14_0_10_45_6]
KELGGDNFEPASAKSFGVPMPMERAVETDFGFVEEAKILSNENNESTPIVHHKPHKFIGIGVGIGLLVLLTLGVIGVYFWSSAVVYLTPESKTISQEMELSLDASIAASDPEARVIKAEQFAAEFTSSQTTESSGVALVGEKASGTVTIFNKTQEEKAFAAGTKFSTNELVFTLDEDTTVPAATVNSSGNETSVITSGKKTATITAAAIGAESNLAKDTEMTIESFASSSYVATGEQDFTGGASREVRVVSNTDIELLVSDAKKDILAQAEQQFSEKSGSGLHFLPPQQLEIVSSTTTSKEGTETDSVTATIVASVKTLTYKTEDLLPIATAALQSEIPEGFVLKDQEPEILSTANEEADLSKKITLDVNISAQAIAQFDKEELRSKILGESFEAAKNILVANSKIHTATIELRPAGLAVIWHRVPRHADRVTMEILGDASE